MRVLTFWFCARDQNHEYGVAYRSRQPGFGAEAIHKAGESSSVLKAAPAIHWFLAKYLLVRTQQVPVRNDILTESGFS